MREFFYNLVTDKYKGIFSAAIKFFLFMLSLIYGLAVKILIFFYRLKPRRLNCKVISVGNITLGGTGKTSLVEFIARYLKQEGHKVAILSRGYKKESARAQEHKSTSYEVMGDEPYMLSKKLAEVPVIVDADRIRGAKKAIEEHGADTVILDDGLQQWRINKDLEIVTIDSLNPFGNGYLLPRGILRQPLSSLKRADIFILTKANINPDTKKIKDALRRLNPAATIAESMHMPVGFYEIGRPEELFRAQELKEKTVTLFSGIGDPGSFEKLVAGLGINIGLSFRFPDHHNYSVEDLDKIIEESKRKNIDTFITTEKDAVRVSVGRGTWDVGRILVLRIELEIKGDDKERFYNRVLTLYPL